MDETSLYYSSLDLGYFAERTFVQFYHYMIFLVHNHSLTLAGLLLSMMFLMKKMSKEIGIFTETMAKVYTAQGHWGRAAEIYRYLLSESPARKELADALAEVEMKLNTDSPKEPDQLVSLFREWIELLLKREKLQRLNNLKERI